MLAVLLRATPSFGASGFESSVLYFLIGGEYVVGSKDFTVTLITTSAGATPSSLPTVKTTALDFAYENNTGGAVSLGFGYYTSGHVAFEFEYKYVTFSLLDTNSPLNLSSTNVDSNQYHMQTSMSEFLFNIYIYYDNTYNSVFFAGIGGGLASVKNTMSGPLKKTPTNSQQDEVITGNLFNFKTSEPVAQLFAGINFVMTKDMSIYIRGTATMIPTFGIEDVAPYKVSKDATGSAVPPFVPGEPLRYSLHGIFYQFYTIGVGIHASFG
jgi:hypothetical protein